MVRGAPLTQSLPEQRQASSSKGFEEGHLRGLAGDGSDTHAVSRRTPPALRVGPHRRFQGLDLHWRSPESGDVWYKPGRWRQTERTAEAPATYGVTSGPP